MVVSINHADAAIYDRNGDLALVVEVKHRWGTDTAWATRMRQNMLRHGFVHTAPYFLLAMPDHFYIWQSNSQSQATEPDYAVDSRPYLEPYSQILGVELRDLSEAGFEFLIVSWFQELLRSNELPSGIATDATWLVDSGLWERIRQGTIVSETLI